MIQLGAHGTLEWLPGKAVALSEDCAPEALLGPMPLIYPFIVNNPGEAAQAKRRARRGHRRPSDAAADHGRKRTAISRNSRICSTNTPRREQMDPRRASPSRQHDPGARRGDRPRR